MCFSLNRVCKGSTISAETERDSHTAPIPTGPRSVPRPAAGSGPTAGLSTDALPNIWTDRATFDGQMAKLIAESGKLVGVVNGGNIDAIRAQAKATGGTCAGCHRQFRADN